MSTVTRAKDTNRDEACASAVETCRVALADYRAGLLDATELRRALVSAGVVRRPGEVWLLDLGCGRWWRYDGVSFQTHTDPAVHAALVQLRNVIEELS